MNGTQQRLHRTVTERLSDRLDAVEPLVDRLMHNGDALYVGHEANAAKIAALEGCVQALIPLLQVDGGFQGIETLYRFRAFSFWQRLKWLVFGG